MGTPQDDRSVEAEVLIEANYPSVIDEALATDHVSAESSVDPAAGMKSQPQSAPAGASWSNMHIDQGPDLEAEAAELESVRAERDDLVRRLAVAVGDREREAAGRADAHRRATEAEARLDMLERKVERLRAKLERWRAWNLRRRQGEQEAASRGEPAYFCCLDSDCRVVSVVSVDPTTARAWSPTRCSTCGGSTATLDRAEDLPHANELADALHDRVDGLLELGGARQALDELHRRGGIERDAWLVALGWIAQRDEGVPGAETELRRIMLRALAPRV